MMEKQINPKSGKIGKPLRVDVIFFITRFLKSVDCLLSRFKAAFSILKTMNNCHFFSYIES